MLGIVVGLICECLRQVTLKLDLFCTQIISNFSWQKQTTYLIMRQHLQCVVRVYTEFNVSLISQGIWGHNLARRFPLLYSNVWLWWNIAHHILKKHNQ